jgi:hypothetical protein
MTLKEMLDTFRNKEGLDPEWAEAACVIINTVAEETMREVLPDEFTPEIEKKVKKFYS